jgi:hypothetical protein
MVITAGTLFTGHSKRVSLVPVIEVIVLIAAFAGPVVVTNEVSPAVFVTKKFEPIRFRTLVPAPLVYISAKMLMLCGGRIASKKRRLYARRSLIAKTGSVSEKGMPPISLRSAFVTSFISVLDSTTSQVYIEWMLLELSDDIIDGFSVDRLT